MFQKRKAAIHIQAHHSVSQNKHKKRKKNQYYNLIPIKGFFLCNYLLRGLYPVDWPLSSTLPSVLEVGLSDSQLKH